MLECCAVLPFDDENLPLFTVGQVAQMLEVQHAFLRRLDEFGVVRPSRSSGGQRRYSRTEVTIVRYVAQLADEGMTLAAIRRVLELEDQVRALEAERDALLTAIAERDELLAALTSRRRSGPAALPRRGGSPQRWIRGSTPENRDGSRDRPGSQ
jgi:MerR family transcriptional regulator/heat shock protein HspR